MDKQEKSSKSMGKMVMTSMEIELRNLPLDHLLRMGEAHLGESLSILLIVIMVASLA